ncbi:MAG: hypothetical protein WCK83_05255 [Burkholderiales bacterium]
MSGSTQAMQSNSLAYIGQNATAEDVLRALSAGWMHAPWGMAVVDAAGVICAINPAFHKCTGIAHGELLGQAESVLQAKLELSMLNHRRVEVGTSGVRAVHYLSDAVAQETIDQKLSRVAELLREPLTSVYGFTELMHGEGFDESTRKELSAKVMVQIELISSIINTHLDQAAVPP